jgi:hypothetical protein
MDSQFAVECSRALDTMGEHPSEAICQSQREITRDSQIPRD